MDESMITHKGAEDWNYFVAPLTRGGDPEAEFQNMFAKASRCVTRFSFATRNGGTIKPMVIIADAAAVERNAQRGKSKQAGETFASWLSSNVENCYPSPQFEGHLGNAG
jgi:hypothetical protein